VSEVAIAFPVRYIKVYFLSYLIMEFGRRLRFPISDSHAMDYDCTIAELIKWYLSTYSKFEML